MTLNSQVHQEKHSHHLPRYTLEIISYGLWLTHSQWESQSAKDPHKRHRGGHKCTLYLSTQPKSPCKILDGGTHS